MNLDAKKTNHSEIKNFDFICLADPLNFISEYQRAVVCMVSTVNLKSTILFSEDLIEGICFSTCLATTCCTFGIFVNILCHSIQN